MSVASLSAAVDQLGKIKAKLTELKAQEDQLRQELVDSGQQVIEGDLFRATISHAEVSLVDWKGIVAKLKPSRQMLTANTSVSERVTVKVVARNGKGC